MPPLQALAALHGFWLMMLLPPAFWLRQHANATQHRWARWTFWGLGLAGLLGIVGHTVAIWVPEAPSDRQPYLLHRVVFVLVTLAIVPILPVTAAGFVCWKRPPRTP